MGAVIVCSGNSFRNEVTVGNHHLVVDEPTAPFAPQRFSLVQTFFGFFVSAGGVESWDGIGGAGALVS